METTYNIHYDEEHDVQWEMCIWSKSVNPMYRRKRRGGGELCSLKSIATWFRRVQEYPGGYAIFRNMAAACCAGAEFDTWYEKARSAVDALESGRLSGETSCRECWRQGGVRVACNRKRYHAGVCEGVPPPMKRQRTACGGRDVW